MTSLGQPNIKSYASPSITPSNNFRPGYHQGGPRDSLASVGDTQNESSANTGGYHSLRYMQTSSIQGRRFDSPGIIVAVNKDVLQQEVRPHTAGHPQFQFGNGVNSISQQQHHLPLYFQRDDYMTIVNQQQQKPHHNIQSQHHSGNTTMIHNNQPLNVIVHNAKRSAQHSGQHQLDSKIQNQRGSATIQYEENNSNSRPTTHSGRQTNKIPSKSTHPNQKRQKKQQSRSAPKYSSKNTNIMPKNYPVNQPSQNNATIQLQNAKIQNQKIVQANNLKKRPDITKFNSQGSGGALASGQMSAQPKSQSRSRSQKRKTEANSLIQHQKGNRQKSQGQIQKPPKQPNNPINKSNAWRGPGILQEPHFDVAVSFDKENNQSLNYDEFSPSRITAGNRSGNEENRRKPGQANPASFFDSDSSISSPNRNPAAAQLVANAQDPSQPASVGGKSYFLDKSTFLKNFSPKKPQNDDVPNSANLSLVYKKSSTLPNDGNQTICAAGSSERAIDQKDSGSRFKPSNPDIPQVGSHRIQLKVVDKMMKEKFKHIKAKDDADDLLRRRQLEEQLIQKQLLKKAEQFSQREEGKKYTKASGHHKNKMSSQFNSGQINIQHKNAQYKKQRSKSCINKSESIFNVLPRSKERQKIIEQAHQIQQEPIKQESQAHQPKQPTQTRKRDKSSVIEMKELKRLCLEELKKEILAGKIDGFPTASLAAFASNKRLSNLTTIVNKKDSKQSQSANTNQQSKNDLNSNNFKKQKGKPNNVVANSTGAIINPSLTSKIKKFIEKKKKQGSFFPKSLEQTIINQKKLKIQENLDQLFKNIKTKQIQHLRHQSQGYLLKKQQAINNPHVSVLNSNGTNSTLNGGALDGAVPQKQLKPQFFNNKKGKVFNYHSETAFENEKAYDGRRENSKSLTPVRASAGRSNLHDNDISIDCQEDYQKLVKSIQNRHQITKGAHYSNSNPPVQNRRKGDQSGATDTISIEVPWVKRDSSLKNEKRRAYHDFSKNQVNKKLIDELEQRHKKQKNQLHRTLGHENTSGSSGKKQNRSSSNPGAKIKKNQLHPKSEAHTIDYHRLNGSTDKNKIGQSDEGSNSNQLSANTLENRDKLMRLANEYKPHIIRMKQAKLEKKFVTVSNPQLLATLHSAAIIIQTHFRNHLQKSFFYEEHKSNMYINSSEEEEEQVQEESRQPIRKQPAQVLIAQMSPLRVKPIKQVNQKQNDVVGSQFYSANERDIEKVVVCSVITSARQDPVQQQNEEQKSSLNNSSLPNYIPLRYKPKQLEEILQSVVSSVPTSGFNTAIKAFPKENDEQREEIKEENQVNTPPKQQLEQEAKVVAESSDAKIASIESGTRKNIVPQLNLSTLSHPIKPVEPEYNGNSSKRKESISNSQKLFDRHSFQDFQEHHHLKDFNLDKYPELNQMLEAIHQRADTEKKLLIDMEKHKQVSPRTFEKQNKAIENWVSRKSAEAHEKRKHIESSLADPLKIIEATQQNQVALNKILSSAASNTHRSKQESSYHDNYGNDEHPSQSHRNTISYRAHSSRVENKNFLDQLQQQESNRYLPQAAQKSNSIDSIKKSSIEVKIDEQRDQQRESIIFVQRHLNDIQLNKSVEQEQDQHSARDQIQEVQAQKSLIKFNEDLQHSQHSDLDNKNDSGQYKGLSRTKNSLNLDNMNLQSEQSPAEQEIEEEVKNEEEDADHHSLSQKSRNQESEIEEESDYKKQIHQQSVEEEQNNHADELGSIEEKQSPRAFIPATPPTDFKEKINRADFFTKEFDNESADNVIRQINSQEQRKQAYLIKDNDIEKQPSQNPIDLAPSPPDSSSFIQARPEPAYKKPAQLEDINLDFIPHSPVLQLPVSPVSQNDHSSGGSGNALNPVDARIIVGGGSLNSTLSAGENGNQDLIKVIQEIGNDQPQSLPEEESKAVESQFDLQPVIPIQPQEQVVEKITEELFIQIMDELKIDLEGLLQNVKPKQSQEDLGRPLIFDRRGIQTDLFAIERYVEEVLNEVLIDKEKFMKSILEPLSKNPREVLNQLQNSEIGSYEHFEQHFPPVLPLDTYLKLERRRKDLRNSQFDGNTNNNAQDTRNFLAECEHIHNKVLFDCINDSILQFKPYGKDGYPLPWSRQNRRLKPIEDFTIEEMFEIVKHDLFRWAIMQAGTLPRREFVFGGQFDEDLFAEIREKKLATLLAREMIENEPKWLNYEFEEAQVKIDIGDMILEQLVTETITILNERMGGPNASITDNTSTFTSRVLI